MHSKGMRGLYTGLTASIFRQMTYSVTRLGAYDAMKTMMSSQGMCALHHRLDIELTIAGAKKLSTGQLVLCASAAGAMGGLAGNPAGKSTF